MKKLIIILLWSVFLTSFVIAGVGLGTHNPTIEVSKKTNDELKRLNLIDIKTDPCIKISEDFCKFKMYTYNYPLGSHKIRLRTCIAFSEDTGQTGEDINRICSDYYVYTTEELETMIEEKSTKWLDKFTDVSKQRNEASVGEVKVGGGDITIREKG